MPWQAVQAASVACLVNAAVGKSELGADPRFASNSDRRGVRAQIVGLIQEILLTKPREYWLARFTAARIPANLRDALRDQVYDATGGRGADIVLNPIGALIASPS